MELKIHSFIHEGDGALVYADDVVSAATGHKLSLYGSHAPVELL